MLGILGWVKMGYAQNQITFNDHIVHIIHRNCAPCHHEGGIGPFPLITYQDVAKRSAFIQHVTETRYMPPWKADPTFQRYKNERLLKPHEINLIKVWVENGAPQGDPEKALASPQFANSPNIEAEPDLVLTMAQPYEISDTGIEDFRFFSVPTNLKEDVYLKAIEFEAGNRQYVHHSRVMVDTTNQIRGIDGLSEYDPRIKDFQQTPLADEFMYGWVPGNLPIVFPEGTGKPLKKNSDLIFNVHYAPSGVKATDQSTVKLYFTKKPVRQEVKTFALRENDIVNQPFVIPANEVKTFYMRSAPLNHEIQLISVLPHMHTLGKSFTAYAITPAGEVVPLVRVNDWDFNWQSTYVFQEPLTLPVNSIIYGEGVYDNTADNPGNPNVPPQQVTYGWNTTDEMMNLIMYYLDQSPVGPVRKGAQ
ncbi:MAG: hypothetical protein RIG62_11680 [Cyclobacteriaceae bacterium]